MTVEDRVATLLRRRRRPMCDACIARLLQLGAGANRTMAASAARGLAATREYRRGLGTCDEDGAERLVTLYVGAA
jgi:hypothetical protein